MRILLVEPFYIGSHQSWVDGYKKFSTHEVEVLSLPGHHWKWRMHGGAITLANQFLALNKSYDWIICSDMIDVSVFTSLIRNKISNTKIATYFHENQLTYPWSASDADVSQNRNHHYGFINYTSALASDVVIFNSLYHKNSFIEALPNFLKMFPDFQNIETIKTIINKSVVIPVGVDIEYIFAQKPKELILKKRAVILWNHRHEHDKNPEQFFEVLIELQNRGVEFQLVVLGASFPKEPTIFKEAKVILSDKILFWGFAESYNDYLHWMYQSDILFVTSYQDFFGISVIEAVACEVFPLLPKRLAYPEHFPKLMHETFFYTESDNREIANRLQRLIFDIKYPRGQNKSQFITQYDWRIVARQLDDLLTTHNSTF